MTPDVREVEPGVYSVLIGNRSYEIRIEDDQGWWRGASFSAIPPELALGPKKGGGGALRVSSPMPGKVIRVLVAQGDAVESGQELLVVEAMKMQNAMKSPRAGIVKDVRAQAGQTVAAGDLLALIE